MPPEASDFRLRGRWIEKRLRNGLLIPTWEPPMPRIPDTILECIFYLYPSQQAAELGESAGGCGFFLLVPFERAKRNHLIAVTNRHVINHGGCTLRINTKDGKCFPVDSNERDWFNHPAGDDVSILLVDFPIKFECMGIEYQKDQFITQGKIQEFDIGPGEDVFTVGRFVSHEGKQQNTPVVRFGNIAQMPIEPIKQDHGFLQESYLVEGRSVGGYSGSPVFMYIPSFAARPDKGKQVSSNFYGPWLLGVNWGHLNDWKPVCDKEGEPTGTMKVPQNSGMMGVVPIWKLIEMIEDPEMVARRKKQEIKILGEGPPVSSSDHVADIKSEPPAMADNPSHKEDFTSLANAAARKRQPNG
jgi:hypothetical protein